jgi:hypothetical protein
MNGDVGGHFRTRSSPELAHHNGVYATLSSGPKQGGLTWDGSYEKAVHYNNRSVGGVAISLAYRIHARPVFRGHPPFLAQWAACGTYTDDKN